MWKDRSFGLYFSQRVLTALIATGMPRQQAYEARQKLYALATLLRGRGFIQISKGVVANAHHIASVAAEFSGNYTAFLKDGKTQLTISRKYMKDFRNFIMEVL